MISDGRYIAVGILLSGHDLAKRISVTVQALAGIGEGSWVGEPDQMIALPCHYLVQVGTYAPGIAFVAAKQDEELARVGQLCRKIEKMLTVVSVKPPIFAADRQIMSIRVITVMWAGASISITRKNLVTDTSNVRGTGSRRRYDALRTR
jgi:hypothetical protein